MEKLFEGLRAFFHKQEKDVYLLMTNGGLDYHWQDIINVICYPNNWKITFAYESIWIEDDLILEEGDNLANSEALIVYYDPLIQVGSGNEEKWIDTTVEDKGVIDKIEKKKEFNYFPIRYAKIGKIAKESQAYTIELTLGDFIEYRELGDTGSQKKRIERLRKNIINCASDASRPKPNRFLFDNTKLVYKSSQKDLGSKEFGKKNTTRYEDHLWIKMAQYLTKESISLSHVNLACIFSIKDKSVPQIPDSFQKNLSDDKRDIGKITFRAGTDHDITLIVIGGENSPEFDREEKEYIITKGNGVVTSYSSFKQRGPGIDIVWRLLISEISTFESGFLRISLNNRHKLNDEVLPGSFRNRIININAPTITFSWKIKPNSFQIAAYLFLLAIGASWLVSYENLLTNKNGNYSVDNYLVWSGHILSLIIIVFSSLKLLQKGINRALGV